MDSFFYTYNLHNLEHVYGAFFFFISIINLCIASKVPRTITLSSNVVGVPFEYPQYYLNKKEKACKARVNK